MVTIKSKFIVENQTGNPLEIKQRGTPDLDETPTTEDRCARMLLHEQRCFPDNVMATPCQLQASMHSTVTPVQRESVLDHHDLDETSITEDRCARMLLHEQRCTPVYHEALCL